MLGDVLYAGWFGFVPFPRSEEDWERNNAMQLFTLRTILIQFTHIHSPYLDALVVWRRLRSISVLLFDHRVAFLSPVSLDPRTGRASLGITQVTKVDWLSTTFNPAEGEAGMADDIDDQLFTVDDLLVHVQENLDAFYWQSHTFSHLARDDLGVNDCLAEDAGEKTVKETLMIHTDTY